MYGFTSVWVYVNTYKRRRNGEGKAGTGVVDSGGWEERDIDGSGMATLTDTH